MEKHKYILIIFTLFFLIIASIFTYIYIKSSIVKSHFSKEEFSKIDYTEEELKLFCDIGFWDRRITKKWNNDIKVEIKDIENLDKIKINEVDSCIAILSPLIEPIKIYRVESDGNLLVYRNMDSLSPKEFSDTRGIAKLNPKIFNFSYHIKKAIIYDRKELIGTTTLLHEFMHALGLSHSKYNNYSSFILMHGVRQGYTLPSMDDFYEHVEKDYKISEMEKKVIQMLYSPYIESGLKREYFMKEMGIWYE